MSSSTSNPNGVGTMDILAAAFFVIAGAWLLVALVYSTLVLIFLRLRARGELGNIYEEDFGRLYLCGTRPSDPNDPEAARGCYIPLGRIFRRYIAHLQYDANGHGGPDGGGGGGVAAAPVRFMTRDERRKAMETLLMQEQTTTTTTGSTTTESTKEPLQNSSSSNPKQAIQKAETRDTSTDEGDIEQGLDNDNNNHDDDDDDDDDVALCSICLGEYDDLVNDPPISVPTACRHEFHRDCLLDWLQRANNTECPCCRERLVQEDAVWNAVQQQRKDRRKQLRRLRKQQRAGRNGSSSHEDAAAPEEPTERTERLEDDDDDEDDMLPPVLGGSSSAPAPLQAAVASGDDDNDGEEDEEDNNNTSVVATTATNSNSDDVETGLVLSEVRVEV